MNRILIYVSYLLMCWWLLVSYWAAGYIEPLLPEEYGRLAKLLKAVRASLFHAHHARVTLGDSQSYYCCCIIHRRNLGFHMSLQVPSLRIELATYLASVLVCWLGRLKSQHLPLHIGCLVAQYVQGGCRYNVWYGEYIQVSVRLRVVMMDMQSEDTTRLMRSPIASGI